MIHFDFTVPDEDAELIFCALHDRVSEMFTLQMDRDVTDAKRRWYRAHAAYVDRVIASMHNTRVDNTNLAEADRLDRLYEDADRLDRELI